MPDVRVSDLITLRSGMLSLSVAPARGGGIVSFDADDDPMFIGRPDDASPLGLACFPLLPFSNRIANGCFTAAGCTVALPRNHPRDPDHPHPLHGLAWQLPWTVVTATATSCHLKLDVAAGDWPWAWGGEQWLTLDPHGLTHRIALTNCDPRPMPAGIGLHPWLPRNDRTRFRSLHRGEWQTGATGLPLRLETGPQPRDWWDGQPVASRLVDTVYTGRVGSMAVIWPDTGLMLGVTPSDTLAFTVVYVPPGKHHFCVEPVSHMTDAVNRHEAAAFTGLRWLPRGEALIGNVRYDVMAIPTDDR